MKKADKLALKHNLSVKVSCEKVEGTPTTMITVDVHSGATGESSRVCRYMTAVDVTNGEVLGLSLRVFREVSILDFLGLSMEEAGTIEEKAVEEKPVKTKKKAAKKAAKKEEPKVEVVPEVVAEDDLSEFGDLEAVAEEEATVPYNKALSDHASVLSPLIVEVLGADWKKDEASKTKVRKLIVAINGKVPVMTVSGAVLNSFEDEVKGLLA